ncbi:MAG: alpha/beta hydrolase [Acidimicrobiales bacterium]
MSDGLKIAGWLFVPENLPPGEKAPGIVLANGFSTIKEIYMKNFAERFAGAGFVVLAFDYRHFGESEGEPRNQLFPYDELQDVRNAVSFLATQPEVEPTRLGAWGVSLGGGHVMYLAAFDRRLKAVVAQVPAVNQFENFRTMMPPPAFAGLIKMLNDDRQERFTSGEVRYLTLVAPPGQGGLMPPEAYEFYMTAQSTVAPTWRNELTIESLEKFLEYDPCGPIHMAAPTAIMMIVGNQDVIIPPALAKEAFERAGEPKKMVLIEGRHVDMYPGYPYFEQAVTEATNWFLEHIGSN